MKINVNDTELFFDVYGSKLTIYSDCVVEKPTLIVLHGGHGFADHTLYVEFWSQFSDIAQVVFLDQRGCGRSDKSSAKKWNLQHWGEDLYQFCVALDIQQPIIAGVSMGGHVMCEYLKNHPAHPGGLLFCNTEAHFVLDDVCQILKDRNSEEAAEACFAQFTRPSDETLKKYVSKCIPHYAHNSYTPQEVSRCQKRVEVFQQYCRDEMTRFNYLDEIKNIQCPTLLLVGEDSPFHPPARAIEMAELIKTEMVTLEIVKKAGAAVYKDQPDESYRIVRGFLNQFSVMKYN
jgi:proline iminopeptidase